MKHFVLLFYLISFTLGFSLILVCFLLWLKNRQRMLKIFLLFVVSLTLILTEQMITAYALANISESRTLETVLRFISAIGCSLLMYSLTELVQMLLNREISNRLRGCVIGCSLLPVIATIIFSITDGRVALVIANVLFYMTILLNVIDLFIHINRVQIKRIVKGLKILAIVSLILFPLLLIDTFIETIPPLGDEFTFGLFSVFAFYSIFCAISWVVIVKGFNALFNTRHGNPASREIQFDAFHITSREKEITHLLMLGLSYRQISEKLVISMPTVKSHVTNIYRKLGVQNKIELLNHISSVNTED